MICGKVAPTGAETRSATERPPRPKMTVHHASAHQLQEQIKRILELVVHARTTHGYVHRASKRRVRVIDQKSIGAETPSRDGQYVSAGKTHETICKRGSAYPRNSKKRQMTFATTSSFLSSGGGLAALTLVRPTSFSDPVAPRQRAKSIVEDCQETCCEKVHENMTQGLCTAGAQRKNPILRNRNSHFASLVLLQRSSTGRASPPRAR